MNNLRVLIFIAVVGGAFLAAFIARRWGRELFPVLIILAAAFSPLLVGLELTGVAAGIQLSVTAVATGSLFATLFLGQRNLLASTWAHATNTTRVILSVLLILIVTATLITWCKAQPAAGMAVGVLIWPLAISAAYSPERTGPRRGLLMVGVISLATCGVAGVIAAHFGQFDVAMAVIAISLAAQGSASSAAYRVFFWVGAGTTWLATTVLSPDTQSVAFGALVGIGWMLLVSVQRRCRRAFGVRLLTGIAAMSILACPLIVYLTYAGDGLPLISATLDSALSVSGESHENLLDRPRRWTALLSYISEEPFRIEFTNFVDIKYQQYAGPYSYRLESAHPHNIVLATGCFLGIPGALLFIAGICIILLSSIGAVRQAHTNWARSESLAAFGVLVFLLFRNMWSMKLFVEPVEIVSFSVAAFTALRIRASHANYPLCSPLVQRFRRCSSLFGVPHSRAVSTQTVAIRRCLHP